eukprot:688333-Rhodomonas_salina.1
MQCPVLTQARRHSISGRLRAYYAPGNPSPIILRAPHVMPGNAMRSVPTVLRARYAMSGTDAHAGSRTAATVPTCAARECAVIGRAEERDGKRERRRERRGERARKER